MLGGNVALAITTIIIASEARGALSWRDGVFGAIVGSILVARHRDIRHYSGQTSEGAPATMQHFRYHAVKLLLVSALMLAGAHAFGVL
jgi:hypothetical protein